MNENVWLQPKGFKSRIMMTALAYGMLASAFNGDDIFRMPACYRRNELEGIDIEREYHLIKQKKSGLSRRLRDMVIYRYERGS